MQDLQATFSILCMSIASTAAMALGLAPGPDGKTHKDTNMARFNIDLLVLLRDKTKGNLSPEEKTFLDSVISDLQLKFLQNKEG